jgi:sulfur relay (sulfurtransferase) DsrC/TusE family protein
MAKKAKDPNQVGEKIDGEAPIETVVELTDDHKKVLRYLIDQKKENAARAEQMKEDVKAFADKLGTNAGKVNKLITMAMQEEEKGGVVREQSAVISWVKQFVGSEE